MASLTERALAASLEELLTKKTLDKITVKDITDECGVNRQTFYYHFHDVYELVEWIFSQKAADFIEECENGNHWKDNILMLMERLTENKRLVLNALRSVDRHNTEKFLQNLAKPALTNIAKEFSKGIDIDEEDFDFVINVFTFGFVGILLEWVIDGMKTENKQSIDKFFVLIEATLESTLKRFAK